MTDLNKLLEPISEESPCGIDLEYDNDFAQLEALFAGGEESQMGDDIIEAQEPDWNAIITLCESLLEKSKDLNLAIYLCTAFLKKRGIPGLNEGLQLTKGLLLQYWDNLYPQLDLEEPEDQRFIERVNLLENLSKPYKSFGDHFKLIERLKETPISDSKQAGRFSLAHILAAKDNTPLSNGDAPPTVALINSSFQSSDPEMLAGLVTAVDELVTSIEEIETFLTDTVGAANSANFKELKSEIDLLKKAFVEFVPGVTDESSEDNTEVAAGGVSDGFSRGAIRSRNDVISAIDCVLDYYPKYEPGSPVPLLLRRAKRLVNLDFMSLINDLTPSSIADVETLLGAKYEEEASPAPTQASSASNETTESSW